MLPVFLVDSVFQQRIYFPSHGADTKDWMDTGTSLRGLNRFTIHVSDKKHGTNENLLRRLNSTNRNRGLLTVATRSCRLSPSSMMRTAFASPALALLASCTPGYVCFIVKYKKHHTRLCTECYPTFDKTHGIARG